MALAVLCASEALKAERQRFEQMMERVRRAKIEGRIRCPLFAWNVMADETPWRVRVASLLGSQDDPEAGEESQEDPSEVEDSPIAKVMAAKVGFSFLVEVLPDARGGASQPAAVPYIIRGALGTQLRAMECQRAGVVLKVLEDVAAVPAEDLICETFDEKEMAHNTDLGKPMLAMLRGHRRRHPRWRASHFRCGLHRLRTAELAALSLDAETDSFWMNLTLTLREAGGAAALRRRVAAWAGGTRISAAVASTPLQHWRENALGRFCRRVQEGQHTTAAEVWRRHVWMAAFTGDGRKSTPEHLHGPWCSRRDETCRKNCRSGAREMVRNMPELYSRKSFHGHLRCVDHIVQMEAVGMLRTCFSTAEQRIQAQATSQRRGGASEPAKATCAQERADAAASELLYGPPRHEDENERRCRDCRAYLERPGALERMMRYRRFMQVFADARRPTLERWGQEWELEQMQRASHHGSRGYRVAEAHASANLLDAMRQLSDLGGAAEPAEADGRTLQQRRTSRATLAQAVPRRIGDVGNRGGLPPSPN